MIYMVGFTNPHFAIVTLALLGLVLALDIGGSITAFGGTLARSAMLPVCDLGFVIRRSVLALVFGHRFAIIGSMLAGTRQTKSWMCGVVFARIFSPGLTSCSVVFARIFGPGFAIGGVVVSSVFGPGFALFCPILAAGLNHGLMMFRFVFTALFGYAGSARGVESTHALLMGLEKFGCRWFGLFTLAAMLEGRILKCDKMGLHVECPFDLPRPRPLQRRWDNCFAPSIVPQNDPNRYLVMLFGGGKPGEVAAWFNDLAQSIAVMAFWPGGITVFGRHYQATVPEPQEVQS